MSKNWTPEQVKELMDYLTEEEQMAMGALVHFAELARSSPDSTWGGGGSFGFVDSESPVCFKEQVSSAEFVADLDKQLGALLRQAVLRKAGGRNS
jgi:hypothetical protein